MRMHWICCFFFSKYQQARFPKHDVSAGLPQPFSSMQQHTLKDATVLKLARAAMWECAWMCKDIVNPAQGGGRDRSVHGASGEAAKAMDTSGPAPTSDLF